jgi:acyl-CoA thioesterase FadM
MFEGRGVRPAAFFVYGTHMPFPRTPYVHRYQVAFSDTDAARIAFTGRFPNFALDAIEGWFRDRLGTDWYRLNMDAQVGTPFVHLSIDMRSPLTPRDVLLTTVWLAKAGRSSLEFRVIGQTAAEGRESFVGRFVCVFVAGDTGRPIPIPAQFRPAVDAEAALAASMPPPGNAVPAD